MEATALCKRSPGKRKCAVQLGHFVLCLALIQSRKRKTIV